MFANIVFRLALRYQLRYHGAKLTPEEAQVIENKQGQLQKLIDKFQHQADTFILHQHGLDHPKISPIEDYDQFDNVDSSLGSDEEDGGPSRHQTTPGLQMVQGWTASILRAFPFFSCQPLDGSGYFPME